MVRCSSVFYTWTAADDDGFAYSLNKYTAISKKVVMVSSRTGTERYFGYSHNK